MTGKVAFIGLGAMGGPMAANLIRAGVALTVFDRAPERLAVAVRAGGVAARDVTDAAQDADIVFTMLPAGAHVLEVLAGPSGVIETVRPGTIVVDMSTIAPAETDQLVDACAAREIRFIDAPVGGLVSFAKAGTSTFMVGCDDESAFEMIRPLLDAMGTTIIRCGSAGTGVRVKVVNNLQAMSIAQITAEALVLATCLGLDSEIVKQANAASTATNGQMQVNFPTKVLIGDIEPGFAIDLAYKDLSLAVQVAAEHDLMLPVGTAARAAYAEARESGYGRKDFSALLCHASSKAGIETPRLRMRQERHKLGFPST